jgi:hypothetical protein
MNVDRVTLVRHAARFNQFGPRCYGLPECIDSHSRSSSVSTVSSVVKISL